MSRSTFLTTNETTSNTGLHFHHGLMPNISSNNRSNETLPHVVVQSSTMTDLTKTTNMNNTQHKSTGRNNPRIKRNLRDKRRSTGIRPDEVSLASTSTDGSANEDKEEEHNVPTHSQFITITNPQSSESFDHNRTITSSSPSKSVFTVSRVQSSFEKLSIPRTDPYKMTSSSSSSSNIYPNSTTQIFRPEEFILCRQTTDDDLLKIKHRQLEERIITLESLVYEKDTIIYDLQRKLDRTTRDLNDAEQQIFILHQDKLTLIKALTTLQDNKLSSGDLSIRSDYVTRN